MSGPTRSPGSPASSGSYLGEWSSLATGTSVKAGQIVRHQGSLWARKADGTIAAAFSSGNWFRIGRAQLTRVLAANRNAPVGSPDVALSDGVATGQNSRVAPTARMPIGNAIVRYGNWYTGSSYDTDGPNNILVSAAVETSGGRVTPITWDGALTLTLVPGQTKDSDPCPIDVESGDQFFVRTYVRVGSAGEKWPCYVNAVSADTDSWSQGTTETDKSQLTGSQGSTSSKGLYQPLAIYAIDAPSSVPGVVIVGDSIAATSARHSYIELALDAGAIPFVNLGRLGDSSGNWAITTTNNVRTWRRRGLAANATHYICEHGTNDISGGFSLSQMQTSIRNTWKRLRQHGAQWIAQTTITPRTTSTDSFATVANQTEAATESVRLAFNAWLLTNPPEIDAVFDAAALAGDPSFPGRWPVGYTTDGLHPNLTGRTAIAPAVDTSKITL